MGLPNPGIEEYPKEVAAAIARGATVIGSVFGGDAEEYADARRADGPHRGRERSSST